MNKLYFPSLNGVRFIAVFIVIKSHVYRICEHIGVKTSNREIASFIPGKMGVILFFVLSGFLITYLLLKEEELTGTIGIKDFYKRRILRIWPLYFFIVIISFFLLPKIGFFFYPELTNLVNQSIGNKLVLFCVFLPNLAGIIYSVVPYASQLWSVGVEEQFYFFWPFLMKKSKNKLVPMLAIILFYIIVQLFILPLLTKHYSGNGLINIMIEFWESFNINCMAIGGVFAYLLYKNSVLLKYLFSSLAQILSLLILILLFSFRIHIPGLQYEIYSILFGVLILNLSSNPKPLFSLENKFFNYVGKISYGMYMYHAIAVVIGVKLLDKLGCNLFLIQLALSLLITVVISGLSYKYLESRFIKMKLKFSKIISGDNVNG